MNAPVESPQVPPPSTRTFAAPYIGHAAPIVQAKAPTSRLHQLEALRGFAAVYVVLHHIVKFEYDFLGFDLGQLFRFGQEAVILFFIISGFVIHHATQQSKTPGFKHYFLKRFLRIYIPLIVVFTVGFLTTSYNDGAWAAPAIKQTLGNLFMLQDWAFAKPNVIVEPLFNNNPLWSLSYEWWFYMLYYPVGVYVASNFRRTSRWVFVVALLAAATHLIEANFVNRLFMYVAIWWSGAYLADLYGQGKPLNFSTCRVPVLAIAAITGLLAIGVMIEKAAGTPLILGIHPVVEVRHFGFALFVLVGGLAWKRFDWAGFRWVFGPFTVFAPVSYCIYIAHYHLVTSATYFAFIESRLLEVAAYCGVLLIFSYWLELKLYPSLQRWIMGKFSPSRNSRSSAMLR